MMSWMASMPLWPVVAAHHSHGALSTFPSARGSYTVVHQIWLGGPVPKRLSALSSTWPNVTLWTDSHLSALREVLLASQPAVDGGHSWLDRATNWGQVSDLLRYELLYALGGLYVDMDFQCLGDVSSLLSHGGVSFLAGVSNTAITARGGTELNNAIIGAGPRHPLLLAVLAELHGNSSAPASLGPSFQSTIDSTGPGMFTRVVMDVLATARAKGVGLEEVVQARVPMEVRDRIDAAADRLAAKACCMFEDGRFTVDPAIQSTFEDRPPVPSSTVVLCPTQVLYPVLNTANIGPPQWTSDDEAGRAAFDDMYGPVVQAYQAGTVHACLSDVEWKRKAVPSAAAQFITQDTLAVHYWARTWQRKDAQLQGKPRPDERPGPR